MDREHVISTLRAHERELKAAGIVRLSIFGSTARDDANWFSDVDLLAAFDESESALFWQVPHWVIDDFSAGGEPFFIIVRQVSGAGEIPVEQFPPIGGLGKRQA